MRSASSRQAFPASSSLCACMPLSSPALPQLSSAPLLFLLLFQSTGSAHAPQLSSKYRTFPICKVKTNGRGRESNKNKQNGKAELSLFCWRWRSVFLCELFAAVPLLQLRLSSRATHSEKTNKKQRQPAARLRDNRLTFASCKTRRRCRQSHEHMSKRYC